MNTVDMSDQALAGNLKRLDADAADLAPGFDYQGMLERHAAGQARTRRRLAVARGTASVLVLAMIGVSLWRFDAGAPNTRTVQVAPAVEATASTPDTSPRPRLVRADTYLALEALEEHIAGLDDAISDARVASPGGDEVARLERVRAELVDSYTQVRYADLVAANF
jgi:hypothetical protein